MMSIPAKLLLNLMRGPGVLHRALARRRAPPRPNDAWVTDGSCIATVDGWRYMVVIKDFLYVIFGQLKSLKQ